MYHDTFSHSNATNIYVEYCAILGYYAACSDNFLPTFRDN